MIVASASVKSFVDESLLSLNLHILLILVVSEILPSSRFTLLPERSAALSRRRELG
jgi:hypothetical protein